MIPDPKTIGELRQNLAELGNPWYVDPDLPDDAPIPRGPRGAQPEETVPHALRAPFTPVANVAEFLAGDIPTNVHLADRRVQAGVLTPESIAIHAERRPV